MATTTTRWYSAVVFDLFGTLVDEDINGFTSMLRGIAQLFGTSQEEFFESWRSTRNERSTGVTTSIGAQLQIMIEHLKLKLSSDALTQATAEYVEYRRQSLRPRQGVVDTLKRIKEMGQLRGLISNCSATDVDLWPETEMAAHIDAPVLSAAVGMAKPDPRIFRLACERLSVTAKDCLYVGDGGSNELNAAQSVGMTPVMIVVPYPDPDLYGERPDPKSWTGLRISTIPEVLNVLSERWFNSD